MARILTLLLGLVVIAFAIKLVLEPSAGRPSDPTAPKRQLDNVREKSREFEKQAQQNADDLLKKSGNTP